MVDNPSNLLVPLTGIIAPNKVRVRLLCSLLLCRALLFRQKIISLEGGNVGGVSQPE